MFGGTKLWAISEKFNLKFVLVKMLLLTSFFLFYEEEIKYRLIVLLMILESTDGFSWKLVWNSCHYKTSYFCNF
jgi:hypothetical protein